MVLSTLPVLDPARHADALERAAAAFRGGGLVVFPTETVYGIAAAATHAQGMSRLRDFKGRPDAQPFSVHLPAPDAAFRYIDESDHVLRRLVRKLMPGPVTLVVRVEPPTIEAKLAAMGLERSHAAVLWQDGTIGLRCPDHPTAQAVLAAVDGPVLASSANRRGRRPPTNVEQAVEAVGDAAELAIDGGPCRYARASAVIAVDPAGPQPEPDDDESPSVTMPRVRVLREGVYDEAYIRKIMHPTILFVCSGNTCRSPMAAAIAQSLLSRSGGTATFSESGARVVSAGVMAASGAPASPEAVAAMANMGLDLSGHRSRPLTVDLVREADVVFCMTGAHRQAVLRMDPTAADKARLLNPAGDIDDPFGAGPEVYQRCAQLLRQRIEQGLKEWQA